MWIPIRQVNCVANNRLLNPIPVQFFGSVLHCKSHSHTLINLHARLAVQRCAKNDHDCVTHEFIQCPSKGKRYFCHCRKIFVEYYSEIRWIQFIGKQPKIFEIGKKYRYRPPFSLTNYFRVPGEDVFNDLGGQIAIELVTLLDFLRGA